MDDGKQSAIGLWRLSRMIWRPVWTLQCLFVLVATALTLPLVTGFTGIAVRSSAQPVLVDLDIPHALVGFPGLVVIGLALLLWHTVDLLVHSAQLTIAHERMHGRELTIPSALACVVRKAKPLFALIIRFALQTIAIGLPFLLLAFGILRFQLHQRELDYYLVERPPEFVLALTFAILLVTLMVFAILRHLVDWLHALPLLLFEGMSPAEARRRSRRLAAGHRARYFIQLLGWMLLSPLMITLTFVASVPLALKVAELADHRVGLTSLLVILIFTLCAAVGLLTRLIGASFFTAYQTRLAPSPDAPAPPTASSAGIPWAVAGASAVVILATALGTYSWLESLSKDRPIDVVAHRGNSSEAPENTLAALESALAAGADIVEIDVRLHPSGKLYLLHDADLLRVAGTALEFRKIDPEGLGKLDVGAWFDDGFKGEPLPSLVEALEVAKGRSRLMIELKSGGSRASLAEAVVETVEAANMPGSVMLMSFDLELVKRLREQQPDWTLGLVTTSSPGELDTLGVDFVAVGRAILSRDLTLRAERAGIDIYAWTVNDGIDVSSAISRGVRGVITDRPRTARKVIEERAQLNPAERLAIDFLSRIGLVHDLLQS